MWKAALSKMQVVFPPLLLQRGREHQLEEHVLSILFSDGLIKARVKDYSNRIHNVYIDLKLWPEQPARCSCSEQVNCEHAAACLYGLQFREKSQSNLGNPLKKESFSTEEEIIDAEDLEWYSSVDESGHDFFSYQLGILIDNQPVSIVPLVVDLIGRWGLNTLSGLSDQLILKLPLSAGKVLKIELGRLKPLLRLLIEYSLGTESYAGNLKIKQYQLLLFLEAEHAIAAVRARWVGTEALRAKLQTLQTIHALPNVLPPIGLKAAHLREYQQQGLNWLQSLRQAKLSGILADDMGLGKTIQTLAHLLLEKEAGRLTSACLIVVPTSLVSNWFEEAKRFTPELRALIFHGSDRHQDEFEDYDLVISTYGLIQRDKKRFLNYGFYYLILDEAQSIKNARTKTTQVILQLNAQHRLCLTGTPLENHLGELWSLFHFLMPGFLGGHKSFKQHFRTPIEKYADAEKQTLLAERIKPFMLRRTKNEVAKELPEKTEIIIRVELAGKQRDLYEAIRMTMEKKVREAIANLGIGKSQIMVLDALLKLRQVCCDPRLLKLPQAEIAHGESVKMTAFMELLQSLIEEGRRVLVFSQFTSMLELIEHALNQKSYAYFKLTGKTTGRAEIVRQFQEGLAPIFLISLKAGGVGLNLTKADVVIHYDLWWNPAAEDQATDRMHRIGQENPVFVYKLVTVGTVEEAIQSMQNKKRQLISGILSNQMMGGVSLTDEDINQFFKPL